MIKGLIFFFCACVILVLTIINLSIGPIVSGRVGSDWGTLNIAMHKDYYKDQKDSGVKGDDLKYGAKYNLDMVTRMKGMHDMEYTSFIFDIVIGFICGLLGLLHHFEVKKDFVVKTGLIGLGCGIVGFVLTFVYVIFNGLVYTKYYDSDDILYKRDSEGAFAELKNGKYECIYYDKPLNDYALYAKYSDLIKKQYNYNKDLYNEYKTTTTEFHNCRVNPDNCENNDGKITGPINYYPYDTSKICQKLYDSNTPYFDDFRNKDKSQRFLTSLILSLFVCLANIGLAIFGFLLFRTPGEF